jgi:hypothetical protein
MFQIGDLVSFHGINEEFEWVHDVERYLDDVTTYKVKEIIDKNHIKVFNDLSRVIEVDLNEYQVHTKETLKQLLTSKNHKYAHICNKVRQLYRKQEFKFQGV